MVGLEARLLEPSTPLPAAASLMVSSWPATLAAFVLTSQHLRRCHLLTAQPCASQKQSQKKKKKEEGKAE